MTIQRLDLLDTQIATQVLAVQRAGYQVEADLIGFAAIPPLMESLAALQASTEQFYGYFVEGSLAGLIAYEFTADRLDITRLVVHPDFFRRGIARQLVAYVLVLTHSPAIVTVSTGALNQPARLFYEQQGFEFVEEVTLPEGVTIARYQYSKA
jgi:ribosomal protein S18 acetylase RimI-like enzyme